MDLYDSIVNMALLMLYYGNFSINVVMVIFFKPHPLPTQGESECLFSEYQKEVVLLCKFSVQKEAQCGR